MLEQRATTVAESLQQLVQIVRDISFELNEAVAALNSAVWQDLAEDGINTKPFSDIAQRLEGLHDAIGELSND